MTNFTPKLEEQSEEQLRFSINEHDPNFASLSSDELNRRSLDELNKTISDMDKSTAIYSKVLGLFALVQIVIAGLQLMMQIKDSQDKYFGFFIGIVFILAIYFLSKMFNSILKK